MVEDIRSTAQIAVGILKDAGITGCLVGSAASSEYGITRIPNVRHRMLPLKVS
jgi:hypothetical protein